jgi:hypothetical protein
MDFFERHWTLKGNIYSLYEFGDGIPFYLMSEYDKRNDFWNILITRIPCSALQVYHPPYLYDKHSTKKTDYKFTVQKCDDLEKLIRDSANKIEIVSPSINPNDKHYYPDDLLQGIKDMDTPQFNKWIRYLCNEE